MTDKEALKKKLLEWAGFTPIWTRGEGIDTKICNWRSPDGEVISTYVLNLLDSLDACLRVLIPNLDSWKLSQKAPDKVVLAQVATKGRGKTATANPASLALCFAIEKLVDSQKEISKLNRL